MIASAEAKTIKSLLGGDSLFKIPRYQRSFSWEKEQVEKFWYDILDTIDEDRKDYFFGPMIFKTDKEEQEKRLEVIDGQQRLALITIFFACIRDIYIEMINQEEGHEIQKVFIGGRDRYTKEIIFKLRLNRQDEGYFQSNIQKQTAETINNRFGRKKNIPQSWRLIRKAYDFLYENIFSELKNYKDLEIKKSFLFQLENAIANKFKIIQIVIDNEDDASLIFETLNERGIELSVSDLLKNYIYSKTEKENPKNLELIQSEWEDIMDRLEESKEFSNFLRYYWNSCHPLVRKNQLYQTYKEYLKKQNDLPKFINILKEESKIYKALIEPYNWPNQKQMNLLKDLRLLGVKQIYPLLLSGFRKLTPKDFVRLIELSLNLTFRYSIICNQNPNQLERVYSDLANQLHNDKTNLDKIEKRLKALYPFDGLFIQEFSSKKIKNGQIARYILIQINNYLIKEKEEVKVINDPEKVDLEHIMPKTLSPQWKLYIEKNKIIHYELIDMIGNLTLLPAPKNKEVSNKPFLEKCKTYKNCYLPTTRLIPRDYKVWNKENILQRQKKLAELAKNIWKI